MAVEEAEIALRRPRRAESQQIRLKCGILARHIQRKAEVVSGKSANGVVSLVECVLGVTVPVAG